jgi:alpha-ketoglutarate-dependent taurine dioxygenase
LRGGLATHGVLRIRGCGELDRATFRAIAGVLGRIKRPRARTVDGAYFDYAPELQLVDAGRVVEPADEGEGARQSQGGLDPRRPGLFETFHIDDCYVEEPAAATVVHARALPSRGGNTELLDLRVAYERLPPGEQARLRMLRVVHAHNNEGAFAGRVSARGPADILAPATHPLVRKHPVTGRRALYFDLDRATHVEGLPIAVGRALLLSLQEHVEAVAPRFEHVWEPYDVLAWDNIALQHRAKGDFPLGEPRLFWRHMIEGSRPV